MKLLAKQERVELSHTEKGAVGFRSAGNALLDLNFFAGSMRTMTDYDITRLFIKAFEENSDLAGKWLFYLRDVRGGLGERDSFRRIMKYFIRNMVATYFRDFDDERQTLLIEDILTYIPEYGRWDDLVYLLETNITFDPQRDDVNVIIMNIIKDQLEADLDNMNRQDPVSLLAKWLPSHPSKKDDLRAKAKLIRKHLGLSEAEYRKTLSKLRKYLNVVEVNMSANRWQEIDYKLVPSRANLVYYNAFLRHDEDRRRRYLEMLKQGKTTINAGTLFPHDIVQKYMSTSMYDYVLEELWKNLPDIGVDNRSTIVVADCSGSMWTNIDDKSGVTAMSVSVALAIYMSERLTGTFKDKFISFGSNPEFVDLTTCNTLKQKVSKVLSYDNIYKTDIFAVFRLILDTAVNNKLKQDDIPSNILIISDMEFDTNTEGSSKVLFDEISNMYDHHGYRLPRIIFWNVNSRSLTVPMRYNDNGVCLVGGFSPYILNMVMNNKLDPYECLVDILNSPRYENINFNIDDYR